MQAGQQLLYLDLSGSYVKAVSWALCAVAAMIFLAAYGCGKDQK